MNPDGTVRKEQKISSVAGGFAGALEDGDRFGSAIGRLGDLDGDGLKDMAVGAPLTKFQGEIRGAVYVLMMNADGTVKSEVRIASQEGGFGGALSQGDRFGSSISFLGDLDNDGKSELAVGAPLDDDGGTGGCLSSTKCNVGAVWILTLEGFPQATASIRLGTLGNRRCYANLSPPILGGNWISSVDATGHAGAQMTFIVGSSMPAGGSQLPFGDELLVSVPSLGGAVWFQSVVLTGGGLTQHTVPIPLDLTLIAVPVFTQAAILGGGPELCNAIDILPGF